MKSIYSEPFTCMINHFLVRDYSYLHIFEYDDYNKDDIFGIEFLIDSTTDELDKKSVYFTFNKITLLTLSYALLDIIQSSNNTIGYNKFDIKSNEEIYLKMVADELLKQNIMCYNLTDIQLDFLLTISSSKTTGLKNLKYLELELEMKYGIIESEKDSSSDTHFFEDNFIRKILLSEKQAISLSKQLKDLSKKI